MKFEINESFENYYDDDAYNEYEGYNQEYDDFTDEFDTSRYSVCDVCQSDYIRGYDCNNNICIDCEDMHSLAMYNVEQVTKLVDANKIKEDDFYLENGIMENFIEGINYDPSTQYLKKYKKDKI